MIAEDLTSLPDRTLAHLLENLERTVAALRTSSSPIGAKLLEQYEAQLTDARAEAERRAKV